MDKKVYLSYLLELKEFLKDHPEQTKVYSDINLSRTILTVKYEIMKEEEKAHVQDRLYTDGFETADFNPFL